MKRLAGWAFAYQLQLAPHNVCGPVGTMANVHLAASTPNYRILEHFNDFADPWVFQLVDQPPRIDADGCFTDPRPPGLGRHARPRRVRGASTHRGRHQAVRGRLGATGRHRTLILPLEPGTEPPVTLRTLPC